MNSSGKKRGLAVAAITVLAVVATPLAAMAQTVGQSGTPLTVYSQYSNGASTDSDGSNSTVTLLAGFPTSIGPNLVNSVRFSYDGGVIATVVPQTGVATTEWAAPAGNWTITAEALDNGGNVLATDTQGPVVTNATNPAIEFSNALFANVGEWGGEIVAHGTVAGGGDNAALSARGPMATTAPINAALTASGAGVSNFVGVVTLGANDTADATDQVVIGASTIDLDAPGGVSDDTSVVTVYHQTVTSVTKTLNAGSNTLQADGSAADTKWTLKATDQNGNIIQGLNAYESNAAGAATPGNCGTPDTGATNTSGEFGVTLNEATIDAGGCDPAAPADNKQTTYYVVDVNENGSYQSGTDYLFDFTQTQYVPVATTVEISNSLGDVMDDEENSTLTFLVKDQNGNPMQNAVVRYKLDRTGHTPTADPAGTYADSAPTGANGKVTVPFASHNNQTEVVTISGFVNRDGDPNPTAGDAIATPYKIDTDTTLVNWNDGTTVQYPANTTQTENGVLKQEHTGKAMPNRPLDIDYADGTTPDANSILAPQAQQPAGTIRGSNYEAQVTTAADGTFGVAMQDPATPVGEELNAQLDVSSNALPNGLDAENDPQSLDVDWLRNLTPTRVEICSDPITPAGCTAASDGLLPVLAAAADGNPMPGALAAGYVRAFNSDGVELRDVAVPLTIDEGFFVKISPAGQLDFEPTPTPGAPVDFASSGKTITVNTGDGTGTDGIFIADIERNTGFDDDGLVADNIHAAVGGSSAEKDFTWSTNGVPLNPRANDALVVTLSADQESTILPKARAGETAYDGDFNDGSGQGVFYDVSTFDQFANPTRQGLDVTDNTPLADFVGNSSEFGLNQPAITAFADRATNQSLEIELGNAETTVYDDNPYDSTFDPASPGANFDTAPVQIQENTAPINWYNLDFANSTFTFGQEGPDTVPVGTNVTMVATATDQEGQAIKGLFMDFFRGGPGPEDSDGNNGDSTNADGEAFYDFTGSSPGVAHVDAIAYDDAGNRLGRVGTDTVTFVGPVVVRTSIVARLLGHNNGARADRLRVNAPAKAHGAVVKLYKFKNGIKKLVGTSTLNSSGDHSFRVADMNGNKRTKYVAVVKRTAVTKGDTTNRKSVR